MAKSRKKPPSRPTNAARLTGHAPPSIIEIPGGASEVIHAGTEIYFRYLPVSSRMAQWGIYVTGAGCSDIPPHTAYPPAGHPDLYQFTWTRGRVLPEYQIVYVAGGKGTFESATAGEITVSAGDVLVLFPGVWHRYRPSNETGWKTYWVGGNGEHLHSLVQQGFLSPENPVLHVGVNQTVLDPFVRILSQVQNIMVENPLLLAVNMMEVIARISVPLRSAPADPATQALADALETKDRLVAEAVRCIWNSDQRSLTVEDVVAKVPLTRRSLERRFHQAMGHTIHDEIIRCRIERVKRSLEETALPIKRVALMAGFSSAERMTKVFHKHEGLSPLAYRRQRRQS